MRLYLTKSGEHVGTQGDAKATGMSWEQVEVPTTKPELIVYMNELVVRFSAHNADEIAPAEFEEAPFPEAATQIETAVATPVKAPTKQIKITANDVAEYIIESTGTNFGTVLSAVLSRLAELRNEGWNGLRDALRSHRSRGSVERGIGILLIEGGDEELAGSPGIKAKGWATK